MLVNLFMEIVKLRERVRVLELELLDRKVHTLVRRDTSISAEEAARSASRPLVGPQ